MQTQEITVQDAADYVVKYMKNEEHIQRLVTSQLKNDNDDGSAVYGRIIEAIAERVSPNASKTTSRK